MHLTSKKVAQESKPICFNLHRAKVCTVVTPVIGRYEGAELVKGTMSSALVASPDREVHGKAIFVDGGLGALPNSLGKE